MKHQTYTLRQAWTLNSIAIFLFFRNWCVLISSEYRRNEESCKLDLTNQPMKDTFKDLVGFFLAVSSDANACTKVYRNYDSLNI